MRGPCFARLRSETVRATSFRGLCDMPVHANYYGKAMPDTLGSEPRRRPNQAWRAAAALDRGT